MRVDLEQIFEDYKIGPDTQIALEFVIQHIEDFTSNITISNSSIDCYDSEGMTSECRINTREALVRLKLIGKSIF